MLGRLLETRAATISCPLAAAAQRRRHGRFYEALTRWVSIRNESSPSRSAATRRRGGGPARLCPAGLLGATEKHFGRRPNGTAVSTTGIRFDANHRGSEATVRQESLERGAGCGRPSRRTTAAAERRMHIVMKSAQGRGGASCRLRFPKSSPCTGPPRSSLADHRAAIQASQAQRGSAQRTRTWQRRRGDWPNGRTLPANPSSKPASP